MLSLETPRNNIVPALAAQAPPLDWPMLHRQAAELYRAHSNNNEFGLDNEKWDGKFRQESWD